MVKVKSTNSEIEKRPYQLDVRPWWIYLKVDEWKLEGELWNLRIAYKFGEYSSILLLIPLIFEATNMCLELKTPSPQNASCWPEHVQRLARAHTQKDRRTGQASATKSERNSGMMAETHDPNNTNPNK